MRRLLLCLFLLSASLGTWAQTDITGVWTYTVSDGKATITGTTQTTGTDLNIPSQVEDAQGTIYPVTAIGDRAFSNKSGFTGSLTIPEGVISIGYGAFNSCSKLTGSLTIPASVKTIGGFAFNYCKLFTGSLTIPKGVETIEQNAFSNCQSLDGSLTIPEGVKSIGLSAFLGCSKLTGSLTIPEGVISIGPQAFNGCRGFTGSLIIPTSVKTIANNAFINCSGLTGSLIIPANVTSLGTKAFSGCTRLQSVTFEPNAKITLDNELFNNNGELRYIDASRLSASLLSGFDVATKFGRDANRNYTLVYLPEGATLSSDAVNVIIGNTCQNLRLIELPGTNLFGANGYGRSGYEYGNAIIKSFTAESASYTGKSLSDDGVYTLYLPYNIDLPATIEAYTLLSYGNKTAVFKKYTGTLQAYTPYLLKRVAGSGVQTLDNTTMSDAAVATAPDYLTNTKGGSVIDNATGTWKFLGTTNPISNADAEAKRLYVLEADNTWRPVKSTVAGGHVRSLRAFLQAPANYSGAPLAFILDEGDTTTGLETIETEVKKENVDIYTVEGRFVGRNYESLPSGLYIIGGKKVYKF